MSKLPFFSVSLIIFMCFILYLLKAFFKESKKGAERIYLPPQKFMSSLIWPLN